MKNAIYLILTVLFLSACGSNSFVLDPIDNPLDPLENETGTSVISEYRDNGYEILLFKGQKQNGGYFANIEITYPDGTWGAYNNLSYCDKRIECSVDFQDEKYLVVRRTIDSEENKIVSDVYFNIETKQKVFAFAKNDKYEIEIIPTNNINVEDVIISDRATGKTKDLAIDFQCEDIKEFINISCHFGDFSDNGRYLEVKHGFMNFIDIIDLANAKSVLHTTTDGSPMLAQWSEDSFVLCNNYDDDGFSEVLVVKNGIKNELFRSDEEDHKIIDSCRILDNSLLYSIGGEAKTYDL